MATLKMRQGSKFGCTWNCYNPLPNGDPDTTDPYDLTNPAWVAVFSFKAAGQDAVVLRSDDATPRAIINPADDAEIAVAIPASMTVGYDFEKAKYEVELIPPSGVEDKLTIDTGTIEFEPQVGDE